MYKLECYLTNPNKIHSNNILLINGTMMAITDSTPFVQLFSEPVSNSASFQAISPQVTATDEVHSFSSLDLCQESPYV